MREILYGLCDRGQCCVKCLRGPSRAASNSPARAAVSAAARIELRRAGASGCSPQQARVGPSCWRSSRSELRRAQRSCSSPREARQGPQRRRSVAERACRAQRSCSPRHARPDRGRSVGRLGEAEVRLGPSAAGARELALSENRDWCLPVVSALRRFKQVCRGRDS
jgi:hypothetical protein